MTEGNSREERLKVKRRRLNSAIKILKPKYNDKQIIEKIRTTNPNLSLSPEYFSKHKSANDENLYLNGLNDKTFDKILSAIDSILKEEDFKKQWNQNNKSYDDIPEVFKNVVREDEDSKKLVGLHGTWKAFSWNKKRSEAQKVDHINFFILKIKGIDDITAITEKAIFKGKMYLIGESKIAMELVATRRKIFLIGKIGISHDNIQGINLAYTDSGEEEVKCGIAVIEKVPENIELPLANSYSIKLNPCSEHMTEFLKNTQHVALYYD